MRRKLSRAALIIALFSTPVMASGCDFINTPTKMGEGQLYTSGDGRYDPYFQTVHQEQVAAANWADESKAARKPIITALNLKPGASNSTILSATREKKGDASLGGPISQTTSAELELARKLNAAAARLEEIEKKGEELRKQAAEDKKNMGADKADDKKVAHMDEVKREMSAAVDAADSMASDARRIAKEAEDLAARLKSAWTGKEEDGPSADDKKDEKHEKKEEKKEEKDEKHEKKEEKKKPEPVAKKPKPAPAPAAKDGDGDKPKPAPTQQKPPGEVFNP